MLGRRADRGDVEDDRPEHTTHVRRAKRFAAGPCTATPTQGKLVTAEEVTAEQPTTRVRAAKRRSLEEPSGFSGKRERAHVNEIEDDGCERERREVPAERRARARTRNERREGRRRPYPGVRERSARELAALIGNLHEASLGHARQGRATQARDGAVDVAVGDSLTAEDRHVSATGRE